MTKTLEEEKSKTAQKPGGKEKKRDNGEEGEYERRKRRKRFKRKN